MSTNSGVVQLLAVLRQSKVSLGLAKFNHQGTYMSEERATITWEELSWSNHIEQEALVRVLVSKGILSRKELIDEVMLVQQKYSEKKS